MPQQKRILLIEPDPGFRAYIERELSDKTQRIESISTAEEGIARITTTHPALVLLDLALPEHDGFEVCKQIRQQSAVPLIVFTLADHPSNLADALKFGADDFLSAPLNVEELRARVQRIIHRPINERIPQVGTLTFGQLTIDLQNQTVTRNGKPISLSKTDWSLLEFLVRHRGQILPHRLILQRVWGESYTNEIGYLRSYVKRLRDVLEEDPKNPQYLQTESRLGYRFAVPDRILQPQVQAAEKRPVVPAAVGSSTNMPIPLTSFVGREAELADINMLIQRPDVRLLTLTGPGGVGKTRLATHVGMQLGHTFQDGVSFVDLSHVSSADMVVSLLAQVLSVKDYKDEGLLEHITHEVRSQERMLILDNFEHVLAAASVVRKILQAASGVKIMVTSRSPLHVSGEHEFPVLPLALPQPGIPIPLDELAQLPVVALFLKRVQAVKPDFHLTQENAPAVVEICTGLDGLPLAIELAAARVKALSPQTLAPLLTRRLALLTGGPRDLPVRQQTLRNLLDWSYDLLDPIHKPLFSHLAVFVGGATIGAIESVCDVNGQGTVALLDGLAALVDASLVQQVEDAAGEVRFVMLATIREYAWELLEHSGDQDNLRRQHLHYYLTMAETAAVALQRAHHPQWLNRLERDHDNLRTALLYAKECNETEKLARFVAALWQFWHIHGHRRDAHRWFEAALAQRARLPPAVAMRALYGAGWLAYDRGEHQQAIAYFEESLAGARTQHDVVAVSEILRGLGEIALAQKNYVRAQSLFDESLTISQDKGNSVGRAWSLHHLGRIALDQESYTQARTIFNQSTMLFDQIGEKAGRAWSLHNLGRVELEQGHYEQADQLLSNSLALFCELGDKLGRAWSLQNLGRSAVDQGFPDQAVRLQHEALAFFREMGDHKGSGWTLYSLAHATASLGNRQAAKVLFHDSLVHFQQADETAGIEQAFEQYRKMTIPS